MCSLDQASQREHLDRIRQGQGPMGNAGMQAQSCMTENSPLLITMAIEFYIGQGTSKYRADVLRSQGDVLHLLEDAGLIVRVGGEYIPNEEPMLLFINTICRVPFPVKTWVMP